LSAATDWYPERNQLVLNLEVVCELAGSRAAAVLLVSEEPVAELSPASLAASTPYLGARARAALAPPPRSDDLAGAVRATGVDFDKLPRTIGGVARAAADQNL
jgi:hypothetical protein